MILIDTKFIGALMGLVAVALIGSFVFKRTIGLKRFISATLLAAIFIFRVTHALGERLQFGDDLRIHELLNAFPFGTLFVPPEEFGWEEFNDEFIVYYLSPQLIRLAIDFAFAVAWGILASITFDIKKLGHLLLLTAFVVLPTELLINFCYLCGIAYTNYYDTGSYVLLAVGAVLGFFIWKGFSELYYERRLKK